MKSYRIILLAGLALLLPIGFVSGQTADILDELLVNEHISFGEAAYVFLGSRGEIDNSAAPEDAFELLRQQLPRYSEVAADTAITVADLSLIGMELYEVPGGVLYALTGAPRYAYRDVRFRNILQDPVNPGDPVSGQLALQLVQRFARYADNGRPARM